MRLKRIVQVDGRLELRDPFIFGANHYDQYPEGNERMEPKTYISGWQKGSDFNPNAPWRMYHGDKIPGFPQHPHRGFEIMTIVDEGYADHFDSKGTKGRYGNGDVQMMSAGSGILHSEMFPLVNDDKANTLRLFQIWINLPAKSKMTDPDYKMIWREQIPIARVKSESGNEVKIKVLLGEYYGVKAIGPLKHSWANDARSHMGIANIEMEPNTSFKLDSISETMNRFLFFYDGTENVKMNDRELSVGQMADLYGDEEVTISTGDASAKFLLLEGEPINEPIVTYGPFVANSQQELQEAFNEYRRTEFGGWPWGEKESDIVIERDAGRFASYKFGEIVDRPQE